MSVGPFGVHAEQAHHTAVRTCEKKTDQPGELLVSPKLQKLILGIQQTNQAGLNHQASKALHWASFTQSKSQLALTEESAPRAGALVPMAELDDMSFLEQRTQVFVQRHVPSKQGSREVEDLDQLLHGYIKRRVVVSLVWALSHESLKNGLRFGGSLGHFNQGIAVAWAACPPFCPFVHATSTTVLVRTSRAPDRTRIEPLLPALTIGTTPFGASTI